MKHLIIYAHPGTESLNARLKNEVVTQLLAQGHEVVVRDLYRLGFDPVLSAADMDGQRRGLVSADVQQEQEYIAAADGITFIYPIWWTGLPAILKGYIDRVFSYGFAYRYDNGVQKGLLGAKQAFIINTHGKSSEEYRANGLETALLLTSDTGIFRYCGLDVKRHFLFGKADRAIAERVEEWCGEIRAAYACNPVSAEITPG